VALNGKMSHARMTERGVGSALPTVGFPDGPTPRTPGPRGDGPADLQRRSEPMEKSSVYIDGEQEALRYKWIESEKAGCDLGEAAIRRWVQNHWWGYLRARWLEHLQGKRFWVELDRGDFGLLQRKFHDNTLLLDRILDRLKAGQENLDIICWAHTWGVPIDPVIQILEALDINSRRLAH